MSETVDHTEKQPEPVLQAEEKTAPAADPYQESIQLIARTKETLQAYRKEIYTLPADPKVTQWRSTNFERQADLIASVGLDTTLSDARDHHPDEAKDLLNHIEKCENELGALQIDIRRKTASPEQTQKKVELIIRNCSSFKQLLQTWHQHIKALMEADKTLRRNLSLAGLLPLARESKKTHSALVDEGFRFYRTVKDQGKSNKASFNAYLLYATNLEKQLKDIDIEPFPGLTGAIIDHQILVGLRATDQVKQYIEGFCQHLPGEFGSIEKILKELAKLKAAPANDVLKQLPTLARDLAQSLIGLRHKVSGSQPLKMIPIILQEVRALRETILDKVIVRFRQRLSEPDSILNPSRLAAEKTADFFMGFSGFVRAVKLLFSSIGGHQALKSEDVHRKIIDVINSCEVYYGDTPADVQRLQIFLDDKLAAYERPFPYKGLFKIMKAALVEHGGRLEKYVHSMEVDGVSTIADDDDKSLGVQKITLGRLVAKLEVRTANLDSSQI